MFELWLLKEAGIGDETGHNLVRSAMACTPALQVAERQRIPAAERMFPHHSAIELELPETAAAACVAAS